MIFDRLVRERPARRGTGLVLAVIVAASLLSTACSAGGVRPLIQEEPSSTPVPIDTSRTTRTPTPEPTVAPRITRTPKPDYFTPGGWDGRYTDVDCGDFGTHRQAQSFFEGTGGTRSNDPYRLDADHDGVACEALP